MENGEGKLKIYCETSFWSCLVGGPTSDEKVVRWQSLTRNGSGNLSDYQMTGAIAGFNGSPFARRGGGRPVSRRKRLERCWAWQKPHRRAISPSRRSEPRIRSRARASRRRFTADVAADPPNATFLYEVVR